MIDEIRYYRHLANHSDIFSHYGNPIALVYRIELVFHFREDFLLARLLLSPGDIGITRVSRLVGVWDGDEKRIRGALA